MLADAHCRLQTFYEPDLKVNECYLYEANQASQRIETWWEQLSDGLLRWQTYFHHLQSEGFFSKDNVADQISLYAIYIPILREELYSHVRLWNSHPIPKKDRPNSIVGKPFMLYHHPGHYVQNWALSFDTDQLRMMKTSVDGWDVDAYLPPETLEWCNGMLQSVGFDSMAAARSDDHDCTKPYLDLYLQLRVKVQYHIRNDLKPVLSLLQGPVGENWQGKQDVKWDTVRVVGLGSDRKEACDTDHVV